MRIFDILLWTVVAAMAVALLMNAQGAAQLLATGLQGWNGTLTILTGTGYKKPA